jgi:hypothetical protein
VAPQIKTATTLFFFQVSLSSERILFFIFRPGAKKTLTQTRTDSAVAQLQSCRAATAGHVDGWIYSPTCESNEKELRQRG